MKAEMERASLLAKVAALRDKLASEKEEAVWCAEKRCREAEEKCWEAELEADMKARKVLQKKIFGKKYENTQAEMSSA